MSFSVVNISGPMPPCHQRSPSGVPHLARASGSVLKGERRPRRGAARARVQKPTDERRAWSPVDARCGWARPARCAVCVSRDQLESPVPRTITTRRFFARPSAVVFGATGSVCPWATTLTRPSGKFAGACFSSHCLHRERALSSESVMFASAVPWLSVWPWISTSVPLATTRSLNSDLSWLHAPRA